MTLRRTETDASIPTSSMADIAFLLIIFFMVTAVFSTTKGLTFSLPPDDTTDAPPNAVEAIFIHVGSGTLTVDCRPMEPSELRRYIEPKLASNPDKPVVLYTDPDTRYREMVRVYDELVGLTGITVPTRRDIERYVETFGQDPFAIACPG